LRALRLEKRVNRILLRRTRHSHSNDDSFRFPFLSPDSRRPNGPRAQTIPTQLRRAAELRPGGVARRVLPLRTGIGNSHEAVTTTSGRRQAFYDQGLNYLESYVWIEASRSFQQALRLDPRLAMANLE